LWSDFVVQLGYAYVGSNKGFYIRYETSADDPEGCLVVAPGNPDPPQYFRYSVDTQENPFPEFFEATRAAANIAKIAVAANYGVRPAYTYVVGFSNGGWVARRLLAIAPDEFDGGIDQAGTAWLPGRMGVNDLISFPGALHNWAAYRASDFSSGSAAYAAIRALGFPPDIRPASGQSTDPTLWTRRSNAWALSACVIGKGIDSSYPRLWEDYDYPARWRSAHLQRRIAQIATVGEIRRPLITLHGTMDVTNIVVYSRAFRQAVVEEGRARMHRYYEIQNGEHQDRSRQAPFNFTQLEFMQPQSHAAFRKLVDWVERGVSAPAGQCVPRGETIVDDPAAAGRPEFCRYYLVDDTGEEVGVIPLPDGHDEGDGGDDGREG
jgi:hypothetical protein